jgi:hypothetical protein
MLIAHVERYISLRQTLGYKLREVAGNLRGVRQVRCRPRRCPGSPFDRSRLGHESSVAARAVRADARCRWLRPFPARRGSKP